MILVALIIIVRTLIRCQIYIPGGSGGGGISGGDWESADGEGEETELVPYLPSITPTPSDPKKQEEKEQEEKEQEEKEQEKKGQKKKGQ